MTPDAPPVLLDATVVFDGRRRCEAGTCVLIADGRVSAVAPRAAIAVPDGTCVISLPHATLLPGLIDLHTHLLLHPYDEAAWDDQVLREPYALRVARAVVAARATLRAGFTTIRDLGTEGAGYADVGLKAAIEQQIVPGPRMVVSTRAIVATGTYGPRGFFPEACIPQGAEEADGDSLMRTARSQIAGGADWVKIYADYGWGPRRTARPTFTIGELTMVAAIAHDSGRRAAAHASTAEGMRRAVLAGFDTIEHGNAGTREVFALMAERGVAFCPTLAATEAIARYRGWKPGTNEPEALRAKRESFREALAAGVTIANGSDAGVFAHGENARELELLVEYGMEPRAALAAATNVAAEVLDLAVPAGTIAPGAVADLVAVAGDPLAEISALRNVRLVIKDGRIVEEFDA